MCRKLSLPRLTAALLGVALLQSSLPPGIACGPFFAQQFLAQGGLSLLESPTFFAEIELKLLARDFPTPFRAVHDRSPQEQSARRDLEDFSAALAAGEIHPPDVTAAREAHRQMRAVLSRYRAREIDDTVTVPPELVEEAKRNVFPSEFADYHEGALACAQGNRAAARAAWERLLARPEKERRYRSVAAAFMLGALGVAEKSDDAGRWLERAREMARQGFHDSGGLAAASYVRESQWREQRGELHEAAACTLRSIASDYPTRACVRPKYDSPEELAKFAADPLLRNVHNGLLLAEMSDYGASDNGMLEKWLQALEAAGVTEFAGAERVAWLCYHSADYRGARRWLARAPRNAPRALWLAGKLAARDGKRRESLKAFSAATRLLARQPEPALEITRNDIEENTPAEYLAADQAVAAIGAQEFRNALEAFLRGGHWLDAAYVAERLLSTRELRDYVARRPWDDALLDRTPPIDSLFGDSDRNNDDSAREEEQDDDEPNEDDFFSYDEDHDRYPQLQESERLTLQLRWLLGRRLAREGRCHEARPFFPPRWRPALDRYAQALAGSDRGRATRDGRAANLWQAALEARYHGMELLGTETAPDWFYHRGDFERDDPAAYRRGRKEILKYRYSQAPEIVPLPAILRARPVERARIAASAPMFANRFHYRYRATALAWKAASVLPDNDPKLAAMLNLAGRWLAARDPQGADRFYQALENRCYATDLGAAAKVHRWFVETTDPAVANRPVPLPGEDLE